MNIKSLMANGARITAHHKAIDKADAGTRKGTRFQAPKQRVHETAPKPLPMVVTEVSRTTDGMPSVNDYDLNKGLDAPVRKFVGPGHPAWDKLPPMAQTKIKNLMNGQAL